VPEDAAARRGAADDERSEEDFSLYKLAEAIVDVYGFDFDHPFGFFDRITDGWRLSESKRSYELFADLKDQGIEPTGAGSVKKTKVRDVWRLPKDQMLFLFDYGDDWRWIITLKEFGEKQTGIKYPRVLSVKGNAPEQYPDYDKE
jgi:hypothetical protein